jgi:UDP-2,3-diacylglucosamine pyrophosphatase LpxH
VQFVISESADQMFQIYDTRFLLTHGDQFRGGSGIAGLLSPLMIGDSRKRKREATVNRGYDYLVMGHWHERGMFKNIIVNGSLVGYNEYAYVSNFAYAPPEQSFWVVDPRHGVTVSTPIFVKGVKEKYPR